MSDKEDTHVNTVRPPLIELVKASQRQMAIDFEAKSSQLPHSGEKGAAREEVVRSFLSDYLPKRFAVGHGFVVDASGGVSRQIDAVIYDQLSCPVFHVTPTQRFIPAEGVSGVVSVKSVLTRSELSEAATNLTSVALLDRFASGRPQAMMGGVPALGACRFSSVGRLS